jgi:beta-hydroxyacyl-ACP dehydratase FabZ
MKSGYDIEEILSVLPHRYPMVLVDRVLEIEPGKRIRALKNVTVNEPFFQGHFPRRRIMPGVLLVEGMVQSGAVLLHESLSQVDPEEVCFTGIDGARFRRPVKPGDQLIFEVEICKQRPGVFKMRAVALVEAQRAAEARLMAIIGGMK